MPLHKYLLARWRAARARWSARTIRTACARSPWSRWRAAPGRRASRLLEVTIKTGRTHQIRVHLASQGHPIVGDDKYGDFELNKALHKASWACKRMFLHAWRLQFNHPASGERVELLAPLPPELDESLPATCNALT